jgi:hypothetical protein
MNIIELAEQVGFERIKHTNEDWVCFSEEIEAFAALVEAAARADEREACIKLVHEGTGEPIQTKTLFILQKERKRIADAITARGTT